ncbi:MAG: DNA polymerase III subunit alpha, partial [Candidatus Margulisiibacteriota bacterium]
MPQFVHLHCHTEYSLLDGASRIKDLVQAASEFGMPAIALTDHGNMYGALQFQKAAKRAGVKPILGCETYIAARSMLDKEGDLDRRHKHLTLLVKNAAGYKNITEIVSKAFLDGFYYKPRIDFDLLAQHSSGLIVLSGCASGEIPRLLLDGNYEGAKLIALKYKDLLAENYYLEIMAHGLPDEKTINRGLLQLSAETGIPLVATNDVHYVRPEESEAHDVLLCIQTNSTIDQVNRMRFNTDQVFLKSPAEMMALFSETPEAISNTVRIAEQCDFAIPMGTYHLPEFPVPAGETARSHLRKICEDNLSLRYPVMTEKIRARLETELEVISNMGFAAYFLIVYDFVDYARKHGIPVGPGRGSAAGSIVAYLLRITNIDPLPYDLLFERFLNPERISMPDIDMDFCINRRQEVIDYVSEKYGKDHVGQIITFGTMAARAAIRDVGRVYGVPLSEVDRTAKLIPATPDMTIEKAMKETEELRAYTNSNPHIKKMVDMARRLEGLARHAGTHAAGVVISQAPLTDYVPLQRNEGQIVTQFQMGDLEEIGLLKMDFLGLRNLTIIDETVKLIKLNQGIDLDLDHIPLDDQATYDLLQKGDSFGVFQLESRGMREYLKKIKPTVFEDIIALLALYRPGPLQSGMVEEFIENKHGRKQVRYALPQLEPILKETHGMILYQEQVMKIASTLGGFSLGQADVL